MTAAFPSLLSKGVGEVVVVLVKEGGACVGKMLPALAILVKAAIEITNRLLEYEAGISFP